MAPGLSHAMHFLEAVAFVKQRYHPKSAHITSGQTSQHKIDHIETRQGMHFWHIHYSNQSTTMFFGTLKSHGKKHAFFVLVSN